MDARPDLRIVYSADIGGSRLVVSEDASWAIPEISAEIGIRGTPTFITHAGKLRGEPTLLRLRDAIAAR